MLAKLMDLKAMHYQRIKENMGAKFACVLGECHLLDQYQLQLSSDDIVWFLFVPLTFPQADMPISLHGGLHDCNEGLEFFPLWVHLLFRSLLAMV